MLSNLLRAVAEHYKGDPSAAGIVMSFVGVDRYYASVVRYHEKFGEGKEVVVNVYASSLDSAVEELSRAWLQLINTVTIKAG